ncbi:hypothetical protein R1flu_001745 [Riccia fluitans]|uniref:Uncharacterized protein n=1 Tax=Riccia fluitans TaxID=41844 RepID=A0ABD1Y453_9MARC
MAAREAGPVPVPVNYELRENPDPIHPPGPDNLFFDPSIPQPPNPESNKAAWDEWIRRYGKDSWFDWLGDNPMCQETQCNGINDADEANRLLQCQLCGYFWHRLCAD